MNPRKVRETVNLQVPELSMLVFKWESVKGLVDQEYLEVYVEFFLPFFKIKLLNFVQKD